MQLHGKKAISRVHKIEETFIYINKQNVEEVFLMEINTTKESLNVNKTICEKKEIMNIQGDMIVPDSKPDILSTINTSGNVCIYKKEIMEGKLKIDGNILTYIMYLADSDSESIEDNVRGLNTNLDFSENFNIPELSEGMDVDINPKIKMIECKVINGRKIGINVTLEVEIRIQTQENVEIITDLNNSDIQILNQNMKVNSVLGEGTTKTSIKENVAIQNTDNLAEMLNVQINLVDKDIKISYNKILAKAEVEIRLVYLTEDNRICTTQSRVPLVGFIDMPNIKEENICDTTYMVKNIVIKPNAVEEHSVYVEMEIEIHCIAYEEKEVQIIRDMYCPGEKMKFNQNTINTITNKQCKKNICNIREKINVPELENGNIVDVGIMPVINKENNMNDKIMIEGELNVNLIFTDNSTVGIKTKQLNIPFEQTINDVGTTDNCRNDTRIEINSQEFLNQSGILSANVDLEFETDSYQNTAIPVISDISMEDEENMEDYSVVIYVVKSGDTLWKIAKRFGSTVDDIARVNGMERPDRLNIGEKIYIPKYVLKRAKEPIII